MNFFKKNLLIFALAALIISPSFADGVSITVVNRLTGVLGEDTQGFTNDVFKRTKGSVVMPINDTGSPTGTDLFDDISSGDQDAGYMYTFDFTGLGDASAFLSNGIPFGIEEKDTLKWYNKGGAREILEGWLADEGHNVHVIPVGRLGAQSAGFYSFGGDLDDALDAGILHRLFGIGADVQEAAYPNSTFVPPAAGSLGAVRTALQGGTEICMVELANAYTDNALVVQGDSSTSITQLMASVCGYPVTYYTGTWHSPILLSFFVINQDLWDSLTSKERKAIEKAAEKNLQKSAKNNRWKSRLALNAIAAAGVNIEDSMPSDVLDNLEAEVCGVLDGLRDGDIFEEFLDSYNDFTGLCPNP